jgi:glucose uptake protein
MTMGIALLVGIAMGLAGQPVGNLMMLELGCAMVLGSVVVSAVLYRMKAVAEHEVLARSGHAKSTRRPSPIKAIILSLVGGLLIGGFAPLMGKARMGDLGLGPYALSAVFAFGVFFSSLVFNIFFMNLPVEGEPVDFGAYFSGRLKQHLLGLSAGVIWLTGVLALMVASSVPEQSQIPVLEHYLLAQASPVLTALWGIVVFREFKDGDVRIKTLGALMLVLLLCGMVMIGLAPLYLRKV